MNININEYKIKIKFIIIFQIENVTKGNAAPYGGRYGYCSKKISPT